MKVYLATSGEYSDYRVEHVFTCREDAEAYALGERVEEHELHEGPVEVRYWYTLTWSPGIPDRERSSLALENPYQQSDMRDFDGVPWRVSHRWYGPLERTHDVLIAEGWEINRVRKVYSEQRAQYLARKQGIS